MSEKWYLHIEGDQYGPYTRHEINEFAREGRLLQQDMVWQESMPEWIAAGYVEGLFPGSEEKRVPEKRAVKPEREEEELVGIIPEISMKAGILKKKYYTLVVTRKRLVFAEATQRLLKDALGEANEASKGQGLFRRMGASLSSQVHFHQRYRHMPVSEILAESRNNFSIPCQQVHLVKFRFSSIDEEYGQREEDSFVLKTAHGDYKFSVGGNQGGGHARHVLRETLGNVVK